VYLLGFDKIGNVAVVVGAAGEETLAGALAGDAGDDADAGHFRANVDGAKFGRSPDDAHGPRVGNHATSGSQRFAEVAVPDKALVALAAGGAHGADGDVDADAKVECARVEELAEIGELALDGIELGRLVRAALVDVGRDRDHGDLGDAEDFGPIVRLGDGLAVGDDDEEQACAMV
jgi:hypothetical protein